MKKLIFALLLITSFASAQNQYGNQFVIKGLTYPVSTGNNSTAQLAAGASFTGTAETIASQQAAQISIVMDQPYTLWIEQYKDAGATKLVSRDIIYREKGVPYNENVTLPGDYFRLVVKNTGIATTTTLDISVTFGISVPS